MKLSVVIPVYNEAATIDEIVDRVQAVDYDKQIVITDDFSKDGSRFLGGPHRVLYFWHYVGNWLLTLLSNVMTNLNLTDMETCYKAFRREVLDGLKIRSNRFGFEPEFTAKVAKRRFRIYEVPISYSGRTYSEGKKIGWKDGVQAISTILRYRFFD